MTLQISPSGDLVFKGPFDVVSITTLKLSNTSSERLAYKIKTTAPRRYCVKPNSGFLEPQATINVQVMLQPQTSGQEDDRNKHKFMIQWTKVPSTYENDVDNFWKQEFSKENVQDTKLKCVFAEEQQPAVVPNDSHGQRDVDGILNRVDGSDDSSKLHLKQELDQLRNENEALKEQYQQQEFRKRNVGSDRVDNPVVNRLKLNEQQQKGPVLFGIALTQQIVLVSFVIALLFGFSLGYFLFSCDN